MKGREDEQAVDGFTWAEVRHFVYDSVVTAKCSECGAEQEVEPDAEAYPCHHGCGAEGTVTSPLVKLKLV